MRTLWNVIKKTIQIFCAGYLGFGALCLTAITAISSIVLIIFGCKIVFGFINFFL